MQVQVGHYVAEQMENFIEDWGGDYWNWCCGVALDLEDRLFMDHLVDRRIGLYVHGDAGSDVAAKQVIEFLAAKGCMPTAKQEESGSRLVYAYRITATTRQ
ncbi:MAG: hypothetical protein QOH06_5008 [Acidobacteriota bacterium]|jgi:hypothetical protein|nr:hypothetical protein [Acidobacteriota bacterium]